jgi:hypothetical protein
LKLISSQGSTKVKKKKKKKGSDTLPWNAECIRVLGRIKGS